MKVEEIEKLLAEYYEGNTSENQEETLLAYFKEQPVPKHLEQEKKLFLNLHEEIPLNVPCGLEAKLNRLIDARAEKEKASARKKLIRRNWYRIGGIAACIALLIGLGHNIHSDDHISERPTETFTDSQVAYDVLQATLMEVSMGLNNGFDEIIESQKEIRRSNGEIKRDLQLQ